MKVLIDIGSEIKCIDCRHDLTTQFMSDYISVHPCQPCGNKAEYVAYEKNLEISALKKELEEVRRLNLKLQQDGGYIK